MVGRSAGTPHFHASGEREMLSNLPQSRAAPSPPAQSAAGSGGQCKMEQEARFCTEKAHAGRKGLHGHQIKFFLLIWLSQVLYIIVFMYVSWPCGSLLLHGLFLVVESGAALRCGAQASHSGGFSCRGTWILGHLGVRSCCTWARESCFLGSRA